MTILVPVPAIEDWERDVIPKPCSQLAFGGVLTSFRPLAQASPKASLASTNHAAGDFARQYDEV
jgi:hypothetical protein